MKFKKVLLIIATIGLALFLVSCDFNQDKIKDEKDNTNHVEDNKDIKELNVNGIKNYSLYDREFDLEKDYEIILNQYKDVLGENIKILNKSITGFTIKKDNFEKNVTLLIDKYFSIKKEQDIVIENTPINEKYFKQGELIKIKVPNTTAVRINKKVIKVENDMFEFNLEEKTEISKGFYEEITTEQASKIIDKNNGFSHFVLLDVRTKAEFDEGHLSNAYQLDFNKSDLFIKELDNLDRDKTYLVYCRTDNRSRKAVEHLHNLGFKNIYVMLGGFTKWAKEGRDYPKPLKHQEEYIFTVNNLLEKYNSGQNLELNIKLSTQDDFKHKNFSIKIFDNERNLVSDNPNMSLGETSEKIVKISKEISKRYKEAEYNFVYTIPNTFNKPYYYIQITYIENQRQYTYFKVFDLNKQREEKTFKQREEKGLYSHLNQPISDLNYSKLLERYHQIILNNQAIDKDYKIVNLFDRVDLEKETLIILMSPLCGSCMELWSDLSKYDFNSINLIPLITSINKENTKESIDESKSSMMSDEKLVESAIYDGVSFVWQNLDFSTTPKYLLLNNKGKLINYTEGDQVKKLIEIFEKTFEKKFVIKGQNDNDSNQNGSNGNQDNNQGESDNGKEEDQNSNSNSEENGENDYEFKDEIASGLLTNEKQPYYFEDRLTAKHYFDVDSNPNMVNIIKAKYTLNFSKQYLTNLNGLNKELDTIRDNQKINIIIILRENELVDNLNKLKERIANIKEYIKYANLYFILDNINDINSANSYLSGFSTNFKDNLFYLSSSSITNKLDYPWYPLMLVLDYKYSLTDIAEFKNLLNEDKNIFINYAKKITNTYSKIKEIPVDRTYGERVANGEFTYLTPHRRKIFENKKLYAKDLGEFNLLNDKGEEVKLKDLNKSDDGNEKLTLLVISKRDCRGCHGAWKELEAYIKYDNLLDMYNYYDYISGVKTASDLNIIVRQYGIKDVSHFFYHSTETNFDYLYVGFTPSFLILDKNNKIAAAIQLDKLTITSLKEIYNKIKGSNSVLTK